MTSVPGRHGVPWRRNNPRGSDTQKASAVAQWDRCQWGNCRPAFSRELDGVHIDAGGLGVGILRAAGDDLQGVRPGDSPFL